MRKGRSSRKKNRVIRRIIPFLTALFLMVLVIGISLGIKFIEKYSYSKERADLNAYFSLENEEDVAILLQDELLAIKAKLIDGTCYFDFDTVQTYFNDRFYWDKEENLLLYTMPAEILTTPIGEASGEENRIDAVLREDTLYVAADYVKKYTNFSYEFFTEPNRMQVYTKWDTQTTAQISRHTAIRLKGGVKSEILRDLEENQKVIILEKMDTWSKVKSMDGFIGYVENKFFQDEQTEAMTPVTDVPEPVYTNISKEGKINMVWHQVTNVTANGTLRDAIAKTKGVNVISPTWFSLSDNEGNVSSIASADYVVTAHNLGMDVWALVDNFSDNVDTKEALSSLTKRSKIIQTLSQAAEQYGIDGINIDFEQLQEEAAENYIEFIRELSVTCRNQGLVLSIDNYVPKEYSAHYNRKEQGIVADYVIVMGYDEHFGGGAAGSVASIGFVEEGIANTVAEVPAHKVINAIPFYTRIWNTKAGEVTSTSVGMGTAESLLAQHGVQAVWNEETCQNYGEYQDQDTLVQVWLEDAASIDVKLNVMKGYDLAGVASWKLGLETANIWDNIAAYTGVQ